MSTARPPKAELRRSRTDARQRILDATREALEERPWSEIPLEEIMRAAGLTRTAFYRHFGDRELLLLALVEELEVGFDEYAAPWREEAEDPERALDGALRDLVGFYVEHGRLMQALADSAAVDQDVRGHYLELGERLTALVARAIERDVAAGLSRVADPEETARALVWMNERYLSLQFGRAPLADPRRVADALSALWRRAVYAA